MALKAPKRVTPDNPDEWSVVSWRNGLMERRQEQHGVVTISKLLPVCEPNIDHWNRDSVTSLQRLKRQRFSPVDSLIFLPTFLTVRPGNRINKRIKIRIAEIRNAVSSRMQVCWPRRLHPLPAERSRTGGRARSRALILATRGVTSE